jgi:hypothetical protein
MRVNVDIVVRPHGASPGVLISDVDPRKKYYDSTVLWRERAMRGVFHSGRLLRDPRSEARTRL